jgi:hypothetical protein
MSVLFDKLFIKDGKEIVSYLTFFPKEKSIMKNIISAIVLILLVSSCKEGPDPVIEERMSEFDTLTERTIEVHDEVMPQMGTLMELSHELESRLETVEDSAVQMSVTASIQDLNDAHVNMMEWMRDYSEKFPYGEPAPESLPALEEKMPVLEKELDEIQKIKSETDRAIVVARAILDSEI